MIQQARWAGLQRQPLARYAAFVVLWLSAFPIAVSAEAPAGFTLQWSAPPECPESATIVRAVAGHLNREQLATSLHAIARLDRRASDSYVLTLQLDDAGERAERTLSGADCTALAEAAALLIAIAIDPQLDTGAAAAKEDLDAPKPASAASAASTRRATATTPDRDAHAEHTNAVAPNTTAASGPSNHRAAFGISLSVALDAATVPSLGMGPGAALELHLHAVRLSLGAQVLVPRARAIAGAGLDGARASIGAAAAVAKACVPLLTSDPLELGPCIGIELGALWGRATGINAPKNGEALWFALGPGIEGRARIGAGFSAVAGGAVLVPSARQEFFVMTDQGQVSAHRVGPVALRASLAIAYEFP